MLGVSLNVTNTPYLCMILLKWSKIYEVFRKTWKSCREFVFMKAVEWSCWYMVIDLAQLTITKNSQSLKLE